MYVTWVTLSPTGTPAVEYGNVHLDKSARGYTTKFTDGGSEKRLIHVHRVLLTGLQPGHRYCIELETN